MVMTPMFAPSIPLTRALFIRMGVVICILLSSVTILNRYLPGRGPLSPIGK